MRFKASVVEAPVVVTPAMPKAAAVDLPPRESFLGTFAWRFGTSVATLAILIGLSKLLLVLSEDGAKWPQAIIIVVSVVGILASPFVLYFRLRRLWRFLFARNDDG